MSEKLANPAPLGLACFALTTFLLSVVNAELAQKDLIGAVVSCALVYGGVVQILAGMWEIKAGSTFGGVAFSSYGGFWISFGLILVLEFLGIWTVSPTALGIFLLAWTLFTFYLWVGTFRLNKALVSTFTLLLLTFALLDIGHLASIPIANVVGGYVGILCALNAWYVSAALLLSELFGREVLPLGHTKREN
jgi:succinate-acetate transporter protein